MIRDLFSQQSSYNILSRFQNDRLIESEKFDSYELEVAQEFAVYHIKEIK
jgi:hypothetical protein